MEEVNIMPFLTWISDIPGCVWLLGVSDEDLVEEVLLWLVDSIFLSEVIIASNILRLLSEFFLIIIISLLVTSLDLITSFFISLML